MNPSADPRATDRVVVFGRRYIAEDLLPARRSVVAEIVTWLHEPEALWEIEKAKRDGCPEYAADRLADAVFARFGEDVQSSERPADTPARGADDAESHGKRHSDG